MSRFPISDEALKRHVAILGMTGAGKSTTARVIVEHVVAQGHRVCILDTIKSDWWGITSSASGTKAGLPFKILGGPRGHYRLPSSAGKVVGQLVGSGKLPLSIIDMADFEPGGPQRFFVDFVPALIRNMKGVLYLVIEEAHELAPKERAGFDKENMGVHYAKRIATGSRTRGVRMIVATQRVQSLHNAVLGSCETVITHRIGFHDDQVPVLKWMRSKIGKDNAAKVEAELANLPDGVAYVAAGAPVKIFDRVKMPMFKTFDNTKTPDGEAGEIDVKTAPVDPDELRAMIGDAVKEADADDPKKLRAAIAERDRRIGALEAHAAKTSVAAPNREAISAAEQRGAERAERTAALAYEKQIKTVRAALEAAMKVIVDINASGFFKAGGETIDQAGIEKAITGATDAIAKIIEGRLAERHKELGRLKVRVEQAATRLEKVLAEELRVAVDVKHNEPYTIAATPERTPRHPVNGGRLPPAGGASGLPTPLQRIVNAIRWWNILGVAAPNHPQVAFMARYTPGSGTWSRYLSQLRSDGLITPEGPLVLTEAGLAAASEPEAPPSGDAMREAVLSKIDRPLAKILRPILAAYPDGLTHEQAAEQAVYTPGSGTWSRYLSSLRSLQLIEPSGHLRAQDWLGSPY